MAHLVFQTAFPGDLFLAIPLIKRLRVFDPRGQITLACRPGLGEFFLRNGLVDDVIEVNKRGAANRRSAISRLAVKPWDLALVPHQSFRTSLWMSRLRANTAKIGFDTFFNRLVFDRVVRRAEKWPDALRQLSLLATVDEDLAAKMREPPMAEFLNPDGRTTVQFSQPKIPDWASMQVKEHRPAGRRLFVAPGSVWGTKRWTLAGYVSLAKELISDGFTVELVGSPAEMEICAEIAAQAQGAINRAGQTTLAELVDEFATGTALVCNDSGAMHAACAAGLPVVAIFGPTTLSLGFRPWSSHAAVVQHELACRPCGRHGPQICPLGTHECMMRITPRQVREALDILLRD